MLNKIIFKISKFMFIFLHPKTKFGKNINIRKGLTISQSKDAKIIVGDGCFFNNYCSINAKEQVNIGDNCIFGENVKIYDHNHSFNKKNELIKNQGYSVASINIGNNCWIGSNVCILKGVSIGDNVVIGAGSIINKDIPSNVIVRQDRNLLYEKIKYEE